MSKLDYKILVNPTAGKGITSKHLETLQKCLRDVGFNYDLQLTEYQGHAINLACQAAQDGCKAVIAVGGDGTVNEVASGLAGSECALGVIPMGTGNDLARSLKLPIQTSDAVRTLLDPKIVEMDIGEDNGNFFLCICGIGFPADVMHNVNLSKGIFRGPPAIVWGIIKTLSELKGIPVELELDGKVTSVFAQGVFILNTMYAGGGLKFSPDASHTDGMLDVLVMRDMSRLEVMTVLPRVYTGSHLSHPKVDFHRVHKVCVRSETAVRKMVDGNISGMSPIQAKIFAKKLKVITPNVRKLV